MVKIVVDSGSTKSDWLIFEQQKYIGTFQTLGLNPEVITKDELKKRLGVATDQLQKYNEISLYFYGSGCGTQRSKDLMEESILETFTFHKLIHLEVREDTYAAVYATCHDLKPGVVCINGTGSNCSYFDGEKVHQAVDSLGYLAMDDFGGVSFGRHLIRSFYFKTMPVELREEMNKEYNMTSDFIKEHFYKKENPNAYLASFLPFLIRNKKHPFFVRMIQNEAELFVQNYIKQFKESAHVPIHFIGSTAYLLQEELMETLEKYDLKSGHFYQKPMDGLIEYFTK